MRYSPNTISHAYFLRLNPDEKLLTQELDAMTVAFEALCNSSAFRYLNNPTIEKSVRRQFMETLFPLFYLETATQELFLLLAQDRMINLLPKIQNNLRNLREKKFGIIDVVLTTASPLSKSMKQTLEQFLQKKIANHKTMILHEQVDEKILGGFIAQWGSTRLDASTKRKLKRIKKTIAF